MFKQKIKNTENTENTENTDKIKIDQNILETLRSFSWFNEDIFFEKYNSIIDSKNDEHNKKIDNIKEKFYLLMNEQTKELNEEFKNKVLEVANYLMQEHNFNFF
jgi:hypothetical protein